MMTLKVWLSLVVVLAGVAPELRRFVLTAGFRFGCGFMTVLDYAW